MKPVEIPREQVNAAAKEEKHYFRIQLVDDSHYEVRRFTATDSTLVIEKLHEADSRYKTAELPIIVPLERVASVSQYELARGRSFFLLAGTFVVALVIYGISSEFSGLD